MDLSNQQQYFFMERALQLAKKARYIAPPNPWVGCVIVQNQEIIGEGFTKEPGEDHAEKCAIKSANGQTKGATVYVTLEPCCHHGRTRPCTDALIKAGVAKVMISFLDPDPLVAGKGVQALKQANIEVEIGLLEEKTKKLLEPYIFHRLQKRLFCICKCGMTLDGKMATLQGESKWITSEESRNDAQKLRKESQAILIGAKTAILDRPQLIIKDYTREKMPLRVIVDPKGSVEAKGPLFDRALAPTLIYTSPNCSIQKIKEWDKAAVEVKIFTLGNHFLPAIINDLTQRGVLQLLVEGGPTTLTAFINENLAQKLIVYIAPSLMGEGRNILANFEIQKLKDVKRFSLTKVKRLKNDLRLEYVPVF